MPKQVLCFCLSLACLLSCCVSLFARIIEDWPYDRLFKEADLVVIATATGVEGSAEQFQDKRWPFQFVGRNTEFTVQHTVKGKSEADIKVLHFRFRTPKKGEVVPDAIENPPLFVEFRSKKGVAGKAILLPQPAYLLFLKRMKDGRYEFVSGKIDAQLSVRELFAPLPEDFGGSQR